MKAAFAIRRSRNNAQSGITLIDMAIFLLVAGLIIGPLLKWYQTWRYQNALDVTNANIAAIDTAIANFYFENNRYPCPADITLLATNPNYGVEVACAAAGVIHGGVPFKALKISAAVTIDAWADRLNYAVSGAQTAPGGAGAIYIQGIQPINPALPPDPATNPCNFAVGIGGIVNITPTANYVIFSSGPSGVGARTAGGSAAPQACPAVGATREANNCNAGAGLVATPYTNSICVGSASIGANFYDDLLFYRATVPTKIWNANTVDPNSIVTTAPIGINNNNPGAGLSVDVKGNILDAKTGADSVCDSNRGNCFNPAPLAQAVTVGAAPPVSMDCSTSKTTWMTGIKSGKAACPDPGYKPSAANTCPAGQYACGFDAAGVIKCSLPGHACP